MLGGVKTFKSLSKLLEAIEVVWQIVELSTLCIFALRSLELKQESFGVKLLSISTCNFKSIFAVGISASIVLEQLRIVPASLIWISDRRSLSSHTVRHDYIVQINWRGPPRARLTLEWLEAIKTTLSNVLWTRLFLIVNLNVCRVWEHFLFCTNQGASSIIIVFPVNMRGSFHCSFNSIFCWREWLRNVLMHLLGNHSIDIFSLLSFLVLPHSHLASHDTVACLRLVISRKMFIW